MNRAVTDTILRLEQFIPTVDDALAVPHEAGEFMHAMILASGAKRGVEIGTSYGYSGLWIASALADNGGTLVTIDHEVRKSEAAREYFEAAGLAEYVDLRTGKAEDVVPSLDGPIDFVLNDADKENCIRYVELLADKLGDRAVVLTDNTVDLADQLADFVTWVRRRGDFYSMGLTVGNGMELSVKLSAKSGH